MLLICHSKLSFRSNSSEQSYLLTSSGAKHISSFLPWGSPWCHSKGPLGTALCSRPCNPHRSPLAKRRWERWFNVSPGQFGGALRRAPGGWGPSCSLYGLPQLLILLWVFPPCPVSLLLPFTAAPWGHFSNTWVEAFVSCSTFNG